jgi:hypothetical protein
VRPCNWLSERRPWQCSRSGGLRLGALLLGCFNTSRCKLFGRRWCCDHTAGESQVQYFSASRGTAFHTLLSGQPPEKSIYIPICHTLCSWRSASSHTSQKSKSLTVRKVHLTPDTCRRLMCSVLNRSTSNVQRPTVNTLNT